MQLNYKRTTYILAAALVLSLLVTFSVVAGNTDSPSAPTNSTSQMYTLNDIYDRLTGDGDATKMTTFEEPSSGPGSSMHTLDDIYALSIPNRIPITGQAACYDAVGTTISCTDTGHDGEFQKGVGWPTPRFTDNGDGSVTDHFTGLIWLKEANCISTEYPAFDNVDDVDDTEVTAGDGMVVWTRALDFVDEINAGTYPNCGANQTDWRLPNLQEMHSLMDYGWFAPALSDATGTAQWTEGDPFTTVQLGNYWTSTSGSGEGFRNWAWYVFPRNGYIRYYDKNNSDYVWPVRGG